VRQREITVIQSYTLYLDTCEHVGQLELIRSALNAIEALYQLS
jgi:hypothetical protein